MSIVYISDKQSYQNAYQPSHDTLVGYLFWIFGVFGAHRFYFGKPVSGLLYFFTFGLLGIGWIIDFFMIPQMQRESSVQFHSGKYDYSAAWLIFLFLGFFGIHRFYLDKPMTGLLFLLTGGLFGIGFVYDALTLNDQIEKQNFKHGYFAR